MDERDQFAEANRLL